MPVKDNEISADVGRLVTFWYSRTEKIKGWYRLRYLEDKYKVQGFESAVANDPKTTFMLAQYLLSAIPAKHRIPLTTEDKVEQEKVGISERALVSVWRDQDRKLTARGKRPWRWELSDFLLMTGWYAVFTALLEGVDNEPNFVAEIWNPANVFQEWDEDGLLTCVHKYTIKYGVARRKAEAAGWNIPNIRTRDNADISVSNYWVRDTVGGKHNVYNAVLYGGKVIKPLTEENFPKGIPILTGPSAGEAAWGGYGDGDLYWVSRYGQGILAPNEELYDVQNRWLSFSMQLQRDMAHPIILNRSRGAKALVTAEQVRSGSIIPLEETQTLEEMRKSVFPQHMDVIQGVISQKIQQATFPYSLYGAIPPTLDLSGFAIGMLMTAAQNVIGAYHAAMVNVMSEIDMQWLEGYKDSKLGKIKISGRKKEGTVGGLFHEDFGPKDIPDCTFVDVTVPLATPSDLVQKIAIARQAKPMGDILDLTSILDDVLDMSDPALVISRLEEDKFRDSPVMQQLAMIKQMKVQEKYLREKGQNEEAEILRFAAQQLMDMLGQPAPGQASAARPGIAQEAGGQGARGVSPETRRQVLSEPPPQRTREERPVR